MHALSKSEMSRRDFVRQTGMLGVAAWALPGSGFGAAIPKSSAVEQGYEYAAGEITLPFAYAIEHSPAPRPECLNFAHQVSPDNCQVFVRMEGELWAFRSQWVINLGTTARYKGPNVDSMERVEDGTYPDGMTSCWFLGGMWYDDAERKLYAPMHIEHDGPRRAYPFSRKIALATSEDKGRTWKYEGDIVTSETYYYPHDFFKFSGSSYGTGVADFGFYVDQQGGYFYLFADEGWASWATRGMRWNTRAVRCSIKDKMAPGKWKNFHAGGWEEPALGGKSSVVAPGHLWGTLYSTSLGLYIGVMIGNQDPPTAPNIDGVYLGCCTDLGKQDWIWGYCPEPMFGFFNVLNDAGTDVARVCEDRFRFYSYFNPSDFQRLNITVSRGQTSATDVQPRYLFDPHPESSDAVLGRKTKMVGSLSPDVIFDGVWQERSAVESFEGRVRESSAANSSVELSFEGTEIYWRAIRSPSGGRADVYIDGIRRKTVDCYNPKATTYEEFLYVRRGLAAGVRHRIRVVVTGAKRPESASATISHIGFEFSAESYRASAGFCALQGKNNWRYGKRGKAGVADLTYAIDEAHPKLCWTDGEEVEIGGNYQSAGESVSIRRWVAPHGGTVRIEGKATGQTGASIGIALNGETLWTRKSDTGGKSEMHDLTTTLIQGDTLSFEAGRSSGSSSATEAKAGSISWDPVVTYLQSVPAIWQPNAASGEDLALNRYARSKVLVSSYRPFDAVDGDLNTAFTVHADDRLSSGEDWLLVDLDREYLIDRYVVSSQTADPAYRPAKFVLQKSAEGRTWTDVDAVAPNPLALDHYYGIPMLRVERAVAPFRARFVRLHLPNGKPFTLSGFELYYTQGKTSFGPPVPAG